MTRLSRLLGLVFLSCLFAACSSPGEKSAADASPAVGDAAGPANTTGDATARGPDTVATAADARASDMSSANADVTIPDASTPDASKADAVIADTIAPDMAKQDVVLADSAAPDTTKQDLAIPDNAQPEAAKADATTREALAPDGPAVMPCVQTPATLIHLSPLELKTLLDSGEDPFLINVKGDSIENIPGTDAVLANDIPGIETLVGHDTCANIVIYCRTGNTTQSVGAELIARGYRRVRDLAGGITAWKAAGYPTL